MPEQTPAVARIVHYVSYGSPVRADGTQAYRSECRAAIITEVPHHAAVQLDGRGREVARVDAPGPAIGLCVLNPTGQFFNQAVPYGDATETADGTPSLLCDGLHHSGGSWHWPARVGP